MNKKDVQYENFFDPEKLNSNLIFISLFIALYENFKFSIINHIKSFYLEDTKNNKDDSEMYDNEVLKLSGKSKNRIIEGSLIWLKKNSVINDDDISNFIRLTDMRNKIVHEMMHTIAVGLPNEIYGLYTTMLDLYEKIEKWWIIEVEICINPDITENMRNSVKPDNIQPGSILITKIMSEVALTNTPKYRDMLNSK
ncbi:MAG: hypothetical protein PHE08_07540 [Bacteroidales bacterium]|nr:hypothetical protein [Bacteroidales bacterium]